MSTLEKFEFNLNILITFCKLKLKYFKKNGLIYKKLTLGTIPWYSLLVYRENLYKVDRYKLIDNSLTLRILRISKLRKRIW